MKKLLLMIIAVVGITTSLFGQVTGDFRSAGSNDWTTLSIWETYNGTTWDPAVAVPDSTSGLVSILSGHTVTITTNVGIGNVTVASGGILSLTCSGTATLTVATAATLTINGTFTIAGTSNAAAPYNVVIKSSGSNSGLITVGNSGVVNCNATQATTTKGFIPTATWQTGSTLNINAIGGPTATGWGSGGAQNFYNINYGFSGTPSFGWGFGTNTINDLNVNATGAGRLQLFGGSSGTLTINGNLNVSGSSNFTIQGTSTAGTFDTVNVNGNVNVNTTGNFSVSRGSQGGTGTSVFNFAGDVSITAGAMSNSTTLANGAKFRFVKSGTQNFAIAASTVSSTAIPVEVATGSTVNLTAPDSVTTLYLNGGKITSSSSNPLVIRAGGTISATAPGSATSFVNGPLAYNNVTASAKSFVYPVGKGSIYRPLTLSLTQAAVTPSTYTVEMFNSAAPGNTFPGTLDKASLVRYYTISENGSGSTFTAGTVTVSYDADDGVVNAADLRVAQGPADGSGVWTDLAGTGSANGAGTILSVNFFTALTNTAFTLANVLSGTNTLPVEMTSFTAIAKGREVELAWKTASENNNAGFVIEQKGITNSWTKIGYVEGAGTTNAPKEYTYSVSVPASGKYAFRLKQIDRDGKFDYSPVVEATIALTAGDYTLTQNYPNPFNPSTTFSFAMRSAEQTTVKVYNLVGQEVATLFNGVAQPDQIYTVKFDGKELSSGIYFYSLCSASRNEMKKMILLK